MTPFDETIANQRRAASPVRSAFVSANAGAGKTRVLTDRVARLLLQDVEPTKILCITFTKAAAAEMSDRLFSLLSTWSLEDDAALNQKLDELEGGKNKRPTAVLAKARRLFARAIETPGGLKIQTIHSFCESVLKCFPIEAGIAPGFSVLEDDAAIALAKKAIEMAAIQQKNTLVRGAFSALSKRYPPETLREILLSPLLSHLKIRQLRDKAENWEDVQEKVAQALQTSPNTKPEDIRALSIREIDSALIQRAKSVFLQGAQTVRAMAENPLSNFLTATNDEDAFTALCAFFMTKTGTPRKTLGDKKTKEVDPSLSELLSDAQETFMGRIDEIKNINIYHDTVNYLAVTKETLENYHTLKQQNTRLDYDDLIIATKELFQDDQKNAWIMYKLDSGLDHILLDEAQDTSPGQWDIVEGPLTEFFSGIGADKDNRTFFAVGDKKQSIYSFQGADAGLFSAKQADLGKQAIQAGRDFENVPLTLSFRTTAPILQFVDALFHDKQVLEGVADETMHHGVHRLGDAGQVELWPLTPRPETKEISAWDAPLDATTEHSPTKVLCEHIAKQIKQWIGIDILSSEGRTVEAGDFIILVQSRGPLFHQMITALARNNVPVAGADRIQLLEDPAIEDLLSYAHAILLEPDELSLAETLKSPFFNLNDHSLFDLAYDRKTSLWRTLKNRAPERSEWANAYTELTIARKIGLTEGAYAFFCHLLENGAPSGRNRLYSRLSPASREPIDEFLRQTLDYETSNPRSLQGFVSWIENNAGEVKRELEQGSDSVRVMTVHGAKGLEGNIVFLLDAHKTPNLKNIGPILQMPLNNTDAELPILSRRKAEASTQMLSAYENAKRDKYAEYRRLLYVAATRARDRLYICGIAAARSAAKDNPMSEKSWHALSEDAFTHLKNSQTIPHPEWHGDIRKIACAQKKKPLQKTLSHTRATIETPPWLFTKPPNEKAVNYLSPSKLADDAQAAAEPAAYSPIAADDPYFRGRVLHRLLELLPHIPATEYLNTANRLLAQLAPDIDPVERSRWRDEVITVLSEPTFSPVFGPGSRAEVNIAGVPNGWPDNNIISGQIDRLVVTDSKVIVVDYKTNRPPPKRAEDVAHSYLAQMAAYRSLLREIYPEKSVESALLWTFEARLMPLPKILLDHAFARSTP